MTWEWIAHLIITAVLAGLVGLEREYHGRAAGLRTYVLVGLGSCLVMELSVYLQATFPGATADPARLGAAVIQGLGFLGAGTIWRSGASTRGLTTAAGLWVVGIVGLSVGAGFIAGAVAVTALVVTSLFLLSPLKRSLKHERRRRARSYRKAARS